MNNSNKFKIKTKNRTRRHRNKNNNNRHSRRKRGGTPTQTQTIMRSKLKYPPNPTHLILRLRDPTRELKVVKKEIIKPLELIVVGTVALKISVPSYSKKNLIPLYFVESP